MRRQAGQSMAEFAAGGAVLSLLMLGAVAIAGYQEVDRRGLSAARQSAWQLALQTGADTETLRGGLHRDFYSDAGMQDPFGTRLLVAEDALQLQVDRISSEGFAGLAENAMRAPMLGVGTLLGGDFDVQDRGLRQSTIRSRIAPLARMPAPFDTLELELTSSFALLDDAWHAAGVAHVRERAGGLVPIGQLRALNVIWQPLSIPLRLVEPSLGELCLGLLEPDRIPEDRLGPGRCLPCC